MINSIFLNRYRQMFEENGLDLEFDGQLPIVVRINTIKSFPKALIARMKDRFDFEKIDFLDDGYRIIHKGNFSIASTPEYLQGYIYVQEAASQIPAKILDPKPGETVLDMCASPGSKTTQMGQMMENQGTIIALDDSNIRIRALANNLERMGVTNTLVYKKDARYADDLDLKFDRILLDAPCSGNFAIEPEWYEKRGEDDLIEGIKENSKVQKQLIRTALKCLKKDGVLVYATCSMEPEENEMVIQWAIDELGAKVEKIDMDYPALKRFGDIEFSKEIEGCVRIWPQKISGFFIAKLLL